MCNKPNCVNIQILDATLSECCLHGSLLSTTGTRIVKPVGIDGTSSACENPRDADSVIAIGSVDDGDLVCNLRVPIINVRQICRLSESVVPTGRFLRTASYPG
jgi:hypothetical protein